MDIKQLKSKSMNLEPIVRIGKNGLTDSTLDEIKRQLKKKKIIKVKFLRAYLEGKDKKAEANNIANLTSSALVHQVGFIVVLYKA